MATIIQAVGRRKSAIAQVKVQDGKGDILINGKTVVDYLQGNPSSINQIQKPLEILGLASNFDIDVKISGGGISGQAGAIQLGIARALCLIDETYRAALKPKGLLTRDPRVKESRKYGLKKARKAPQFSKR